MKRGLRLSKTNLKFLYDLSLQDSSDKGKRFESFVRAFFRQIPRFEIKDDDSLKIGWTDLDIVILNKNEELKGLFGNIIVVQCKNYSEAISWKEISESLIQALVYREKDGSGILATTSHLSSEAKKVIDLMMSECGKINFLVIEGKDWERYFNSDLDEVRFLEELVLNFPRKRYLKED